MNNLSLRLPEDVQRDLDAEAKLRHCKRSELAREVIVEFLKRSKRERFMAEFIAEARILAKNPEARREALEIAEDFDEADAETLPDEPSEDISYWVRSADKS